MIRNRYSIVEDVIIAVILASVMFFDILATFVTTGLSLITFEAVLISLFAGVATFVTGVSVYNTWQEARANKELADKFSEIEDYDAKLEAWKEHIREQEQQEKREKELETEGDKL